jgi:hypothetical protein
MPPHRFLLLTISVAVVGCSSPKAPVSILSVQRLPGERVLDTHPVRVTEVAYRFGIRAADLPRLKQNGQLNFNIFRCNRPGREWEMSTVIEPAAPGAEIVYVRMLTTNRHVDTDNWHCGSFQKEHWALIGSTPEDVSEVFRFQPEGDTDLNRDDEPSAVRIPPPPKAS